MGLGVRLIFVMLTSSHNSGLKWTRTASRNPSRKPRPNSAAGAPKTRRKVSAVLACLTALLFLAGVVLLVLLFIVLAGIVLIVLLFLA